MKKTILITFITLCLCLEGGAQNLVNNPSFEVYDTCPNGYYETNRLVGWEININSADYFNSCADQITGVSVPNNSGGFQYAATGGAYCGFYGYTRTITTHNDAREFLGCQLSSPLIIGQKYYVSLEINLMNNANCGINKIGVLFITTNNYGDTLIQQPPPLINDFAQIYTDSIISDTTKWTTIKGSFIADSSYSFLLIGNFFDTLNFDSVLFAGNKCVAYYYVDNICVSIDSLTCFLPDEILGLARNENIIIYPNPTKGNIFIEQPQIQSANIKIYNLFGQLLFDNSFSEKNISLDLSSYPDGIYLIQTSQDNKFFIKKIALIK